MDAPCRWTEFSFVFDKAGLSYFKIGSLQMQIIILLIVFFLLISNIILVRDKLSRIFLSIYIYWWSLLLIISTFNPYGLYAVSDSIYSLLILNISMFTFGFILSGHKQKASNNNNIDAIYRFIHSFESLL